MPNEAFAPVKIDQLDGKTTSGLNTISTGNVKAVNLPWPPVTLQSTFAQQAQRIEAIARALDAAAAKAEAMAAALSARVFDAPPAKWDGDGA